MNTGYGDKAKQHYKFRNGKPKKSYETDKEAIEAARLINTNRKNKGEFKKVPYKCGYCHKFHLGRSQTNRIK